MIVATRGMLGRKATAAVVISSSAHFFQRVAKKSKTAAAAFGRTSVMDENGFCRIPERKHIRDLAHRNTNARTSDKK